MAPKSGFFTTNNTGDAPTTGYTLSDWQRMLRMLYVTDATTESVIRGYLNQNNCTVTGANQVTVQSGGAVINGYWYDEPGTNAFTVASVATATRKDLIVLKLDTTAQTIRLAYKSGTEGGSVPTVTQSGSVWEVAIWEAWMAVGGTITLVDRRHYLKEALSNIISADGTTILNSSNVFSVKDGGVTTAKLADDSVTAAKIAAGAVGSSEIADGSVGNAELADSSVTTAKIGDGAVTAAKISGGVLNVGTRTGGDANDWTVPGNTTYTPGAQRAYVDVFNITFSSTGTAIVTRNFPASFTKKAVIFPVMFDGSYSGLRVMVRAVTSTDYTVIAMSSDGTNLTATIKCMAFIIGE